jgi:hypothetical protein
LAGFSPAAWSIRYEDTRNAEDGIRHGAKIVINVASIERIAALENSSLAEEYVRPGRPVVISGAAFEWGPMAAWTPEKLESRLDAKLVRVSLSAGVFRYGAGDSFTYDIMTFRQAAAAIRSVGPAGGVYVMQQPIARSFPELCADVRAPELAGAESAVAHFWFGSANNVTPLHYDAVCNLFRQVYGRKRFLLYSPTFFDEMYPPPAGGPFAHVSPVDAERPDLTRHPRFAGVKPHEVVLDPGDTLFLPPFWWHCVRSLDISISVNFWWAPELAHCLATVGLRLLAGAYERDRLATMGAPFRGPEGFLRTSREVLKLGLRRPAILLAGAEIERVVHGLAKAHGIAESVDGAPRALAELNRDLAEAGAYSAEMAGRISRLDRWFELARGARDEAIGEREAVEVLDEVERLAGPAQVAAL